MPHAFCGYGAAAGFQTSKDVMNLAAADSGLLERFRSGHFGLHVRICSSQLSRILKQEPDRAKVLRGVLKGLGSFSQPPLLSLVVYEEKTLRELYPLVLELLEHVPKLERLALHDVGFSPIRRECACGTFTAAICSELCGKLHGTPLTHLELTAGTFPWPALEMLFRYLSKSSVRHLRLRGKMEDAFATELSVLELKSFFCEGSNIYKASTMQRLLDAMPSATMDFRKEMSGGWSAPSREQLEQFEQLEVHERVQVFIEQRWQLLRKGILVNQLSEEKWFSTVQWIMNLKVLPGK